MTVPVSPRIKAALALVVVVVVAGACSGSAASSVGTSPSRAAVASAAASPTATPTADTRIEFDRTRPFGLIENSVAEDSGVSVHDITYAGAAGEPVEAYLVFPKGEGPFGAVFFQHSSGESRSEFLPEAQLLAGRGVASILITSPSVDGMQGWTPEAITAQVREMSRAVDLLVAQPKVDPNRIGFVGYSLGAVQGSVFVGSEGRRMQVSVLMAFFPHYGVMGGPGLEDFDPIVWVRQIASAHVLMQLGTADPYYSRADWNELDPSSMPNLKLNWYDADHALNVQAQQDRLDLLVNLLGATGS
jgi:Dipeptidyl aminopeptidases/acylaminoacyl-peptidases